MCGRIYTPSEAAIERFWRLNRANSNPFPKRFNVAPQQGRPDKYIPAIRAGQDDQPEFVMLQWWLLPFWSKQPTIKYTTFNARIETVASAPSFREPFRKRRCLIPVLGWYEWKELPTGNLPWFFHPANGEIVHLAGLWDSWKGEDQVIESCSIVIGPANRVIEPIHDRNPFVILPDRFDAWLDPKFTDPKKVLELLQPFPEESIKFHRVSTKVNNARNEVEELTAPIDQ